MRTNLKGWMIAILLLASAVYALAEDITLTTYYPSPKGVYQELKTAGDMVVGNITDAPGARLHVIQDNPASAVPVFRADDETGETSPFLIDANGNVGIGTTTPDPSAVLNISSTTKGFLPPRMTETERDGIATPTQGLLIFNTTTKQYNYHDGTGWVPLEATPRSKQLFTASDTFTVPAGVTKIFVSLAGGGGGGGWGGTSQSGGGGGGAGDAIVAQEFTVTPGDEYTVTIGAGGAGGTPGTPPGSAGGTTDFGGLISAAGGGGGLPGGGSYNTALGGVAGGPGGTDGITGNNNTGYGGDGGGNMFGAGGAGGSFAGPSSGVSGNRGGEFGGGGGGGGMGGSGGSGGAGSAGFVLVES